MFDNQTTGQGSAPAPGTDDIFSGLDQGGIQAPVQPQAQFSVEDSSLASQVPVNADTGHQAVNKRLMIVGGVVVGLFVLAAGIWLVLMNLKTNTAAVVSSDQAKVETENTSLASSSPEAPAQPQDPTAPAFNSNTLPADANSTNTPAAAPEALQAATTSSIGATLNDSQVEPAQPTTPAATAQNSEIPEAVKQAAMGKTDSDGDGLTDEEEKQLGTYADRVDTDNDGLSDYEEVKTYLTNPKNPDTDSDGFKDGDEVKNGYNPKGAGKIIR